MRGRSILKGILKNPAESRGVGTDFRLYLCGQLGRSSRQILERSGTRPIKIGAIFKNYVHVRKAKIRDSTHGLNMRGASNSRDDRKGYLVFDDVWAAIPPLQQDEQ